MTGPTDISHLVNPEVWKLIEEHGCIYSLDDFASTYAKDVRDAYGNIIDYEAIISVGLSAFKQLQRYVRATLLADSDQTVNTVDLAREYVEAQNAEFEAFKTSMRRFENLDATPEFADLAPLMDLARRNASLSMLFYELHDRDMLILYLGPDSHRRFLLTDPDLPPNTPFTQIDTIQHSVYCKENNYPKPFLEVFGDIAKICADEYRERHIELTEYVIDVDM